MMTDSRNECRVGRGAQLIGDMKGYAQCSTGSTPFKYMSTVPAACPRLTVRLLTVDVHCAIAVTVFGPAIGECS